MKPKTLLKTAALFAVACSIGSIRGETLGELLKRFDRNGDGQLDPAEFAEAQKAAGLPAVTPAGAARAAKVRSLLNAAVKTYPDADLRYLKRSAQARFLLNDSPSKVPEMSFRSERSIPDDLASLTTYERFIVRRAVSDAELTGVDSAPQPAVTPKPDPIISFLENNFRIRDDSAGISGDAVADEPAKFAWTHSRGEKSFYSIDAAVLYTPAWLDWQWDKVETGKNDDLRDWVTGGRIRPAFEAHVSTQNGATRNQITYSGLIQARYKYFPGGPDNARTEALLPDRLPFFSAHYFELAPLYMTDRVASVRTWGMDLRYEPSVPYLNLNHDVARPLFHLSWLEGSMKGSLGFAVRRYEQGKPTGMATTEYGEFVASYQGEVVLFHRLTLRAKYSAAADLWGDMQSHDLFEGSAELLLDERNHFTVGVSYLHGKEEPTFNDVDSVTGWVGVKF
jgi:hypothetical protein